MHSPAVTGSTETPTLMDVTARVHNLPVWQTGTQIFSRIRQLVELISSKPLCFLMCIATCASNIFLFYQVWVPLLAIFKKMSICANVHNRKEKNHLVRDALLKWVYVALRLLCCVVRAFVCLGVYVCAFMCVCVRTGRWVATEDGTSAPHPHRVYRTHSYCTPPISRQVLLSLVANPITVLSAKGSSGARPAASKPAASSGSTGSMQLFVKTLTGKTITLILVDVPHSFIVTNVCVS